MFKITALGDSQTATDAIYGVRASDTWPFVAGARLPAATVRSFGVSGNTSQQLLDRADVALQHDTPDVLAVAVGVNDPGATISTTQTQANVQAILMAAKHGAMGPGAGMGGPVHVADQASLPATGKRGQRYVVRADSSTTGGRSPGVAGTVVADGNGQTITVWECRYPLAGEPGWGRVATRETAPTVVGRVVVVPPPYRNWTSGGDTLATPDATNNTLRGALTAAADAENVVVGGAPSVLYSDLYAWMKARIQNGDDPDFSSVAYDQSRSWHYTDNNQHYSAYGHALQGEKVAADVKATWPDIVA